MEIGNQYVVKVGNNAPHVLGPSSTTAFHHLAYVQTLGTASYYYDGKLVGTSPTDSAPAPVLAFSVGGFGDASSASYLFHGWIDEVRYQSFNPLAAGAFEPTNFLIVVPEPGVWGAGAVAGIIYLQARRRRHDHARQAHVTA
jgi:hypothetical protein